MEQERERLLLMKTRIRDAVRLALTVSMAVVTAPQSHHAYAQAADVSEADAAAATEESRPVLEEVVVTGRQRSSATDVVQERIEHEVVVDLLGAEQISRVGDSTASLALRRLPGVTLVGDQFIYIRGLGERYSSTTLNHAHVPSPDLTRNVIPLDLFPAEIIDSLAVNKGYTPDMPAAFGGGNVDIRTTGVPDELVFNLQVGSGWNSGNSDESLTYRGGGDDSLGTDDGTRALPREIIDAVGTYQGDLTPTGILRGLRRDGRPHTIADAEAINRQLATNLNRDLDFREQSTDPDLNGEATLGNSWRFGAGEQWRFGALGLVDYGNQWRNRDRTNRSSIEPETVSFTTQRTINQVSLTGSLNLGVGFTDDHQIEATGLYLRNTEDETSLSTGNNVNFLRADGRQLRNYRIRYEERDLKLLQFRGSHTLGEGALELVGDALEWLDFARDLNVSWYWSDATARTEVPNEVLFSAEDAIDPQTGALISTGVRASASAAEYRFTELQDEVRSYGWSVSKPFTLSGFSVTLSGGGATYQKGREYLQTQFGLGTTALGANSVLAGTPGQVFTDEHILDPDNGFALSIGGIGTESYLAAEMIDAAFAKFDMDWNDTVRLVGGVRWEDFKQLAVPVDQYEFDVNVGKIPIPLEQLPSLVTAEDDYYPSLALTYIRPDFWAEDFQLRFGWSETVTRPDLREVSPSTYIDPFTEARVRGNPDLMTADLLAFDIRAEWFFASGDNFTVSLFYKDITNPIEAIEGAGADDNVSLTFINAESAELYGAEVEWMKGLGFLAGAVGTWADHFFVTGNVTASDSELVIGDQALSLTNNTRPMSQHSDFVANVQIGFDSPNDVHSISLAYNVFSERLYFGGRNGAPDAYEQPFNSLDLVYSLYPTDKVSLKLRAQNLLDESLEIKQGSVTVIEQDVGVTLKLDATIRF
jgi:hypothetical protein